MKVEGESHGGFLNKDLMFLEFACPKEARWVIDYGRRWLMGGSLKLEWWSHDLGCAKCKEEIQEEWIRVVGFVRPEKFQFLEKGQNRNFDYKIVNFG